MRRIQNLIKIALKSLLKRNRGNKLFVTCLFILFVIPTIFFNVTQAVLSEVENSKKKVFGNFTDIYYDTSNPSRLNLAFSVNDFQEILPGFHYNEYGVFFTVYHEELNETKNLQVGYADENARKLGELTLLKGHFPNTQNEIALTESVAALLGNKELGDQMKIADISYTVSGILLDFGYLWPKCEVLTNKNNDPVNAFVTEQEAFRILQLTKSLSRQILIVRQQGVSNPIENNLYLLRNTNSTLEDNQGFQIPLEFIVLFIIATIVSVLMIFALNRQRLANRIRSYYSIGLSKPDITFIISLELILLALIGSVSGIVLGCGLTALILGSLTSYFGHIIPNVLSSNYLAVLYFSALSSIALIICLFSKYMIKTYLHEYKSKHFRLLPSIGKIRPFWFDVRLNKKSLIGLVALFGVSFCLLSFGIFYSNYFSYNIFEQPKGMLPKDYDILFSTRPLPMSPSLSKEPPCFFTDSYEKIGGDDAFIEHLISLPVVKNVKAYKEINKMNVLLLNHQVDSYIDANDFNLDKSYSQWLQTNIFNFDFVKKKFGYKDNEILVGAEILVYPKDVLLNLNESVVEGEIDMQKIVSGKEVILRVPAYRIQSLSDGGVMKKWLPYQHEEAYNSTTFHVGDEIILSGILTDSHINGAVTESQADLFYRQDVITKIGAIIRDTSGILPVPGNFGKAFSILTTQEALPIFNIDAAYSNICIYTSKGYTIEEISSIFAGLSNMVPNMVLKDVQRDIKTFRIYNLMTDIFVASLLSIVIITSLMITSSMLFTKTKLCIKNYSLMRINGLSFCKIISIWSYQVVAVTTFGCLLGLPLSLILFWRFGTYAHFDVMFQISHYFPLINFVYIFAGIVLIATISGIPSIIYFYKHKNDVLNDIQ